MTSKGRLRRFVDAALLGREDATALGLFRVVLVSVFTLSMLTHIGAVAEYFSDASMLAMPHARKAFHSRWSVFFYVSSPGVVQAIFAVGVLAHLMWLVGLFTRVSSLVAFVVWASMVGRNPLLYSMPDQFHTVLAFYLMLLPSGRGLSLDASWRGRGGPVPVWCRRVLQLQLAVLYTGGGLLKDGPAWTETGTAIYYAAVNPYNRHFFASSVLATLQPYVLRPMTYSVLLFEVGFAGFVLLHWIREASGSRRIPDLRRWFLGYGVLMHLGIQSLMYVAWFTPLTIGSYTAFLQPNQARALIDRLLRRSKEKLSVQQTLTEDANK